MSNILHNDYILNEYIDRSDINFINFNFPDDLEKLISCNTLIHGPKEMRQMHPKFWNQSETKLPVNVNHLIIKCSWEGTWNYDYIDTWRQDVENLFKTKTTLITQNEYASTQLRNVGYLHYSWLASWWAWFPYQKYVKSRSDEFYVNPNPEYIFNFIIGTERSQKTLMYNKLINRNRLKNKYVYVSPYSVNVPRVDLTIDDITRGVPKQLTSNFDDSSNSENIERYRALYCLLNSRISLVIETEMTNWTNRYTEKTLKPMSVGQPFVLAGNYRCLDLLRRDGFKTFDTFIDETYDTIEDTNQRMNHVCDELERLCNFTQNEWEEFLNHVKPIVEHNKQHYTTLRDRYINDLFEFIE